MGRPKKQKAENQVEVAAAEIKEAAKNKEEIDIKHFSSKIRRDMFNERRYDDKRIEELVDRLRKEFEADFPVCDYGCGTLTPVKAGLYIDYTGKGKTSGKSLRSKILKAMTDLHKSIHTLATSKSKLLEVDMSAVNRELGIKQEKRKATGARLAASHAEKKAKGQASYSDLKKEERAYYNHLPAGSEARKMFLALSATARKEKAEDWAKKGGSKSEPAAAEKPKRGRPKGSGKQAAAAAPAPKRGGRIEMK